jgi:urease accessory protein
LSAQPASAGAPYRSHPVLAAYGGGWNGRLEIALARRGDRTVAACLAHQGPLRVQKLLWPEGSALAHAILLHPPAGLAGGDSLTLTIALEPGSAGLFTTPGAGRWYRGDARASQAVSIRLDAGAELEWLPQETVLHDGVIGAQSLRVDVATDATAVGIDVLVLGRRASGERLARADFDSRLELVRGGRRLLTEHARVDARSFGAAALGEAHVSGLLWALSPQPMDVGLAERCEAAIDAMLGVDDPHAAASRGWGIDATIGGASLVDPHLLLVRVVGRSPQTVRAALVAVWAVLRPPLFRRDAVLPRIWHT